MVALSDVFVPVRPDTDGFEPNLRRQLGRVDARPAGKQVATRFGVGFNGAIGGIVSRSAGIFAAGFALIQGAKIFGGFINDARESAKVGRLTAAVVKSTGGAAKITADQVGALATAISNKTGADDEAIQSGSNLLLTFTNVRNEVGKGNDIFNQASQTIVDMTAALNGGEVSQQGIKASSIQLGKALNDPIKGVTALQKVGVSFTEQQKKQIKSFVDSGKTMEAQKVILRELGKEFGGAAQAAADPVTRLKTVAGNLSESLGGLLLPVVDKVANFISDTFVPGIYALGAAFKDPDVTSDGFVGFMERVGVFARRAFDYFKSDVLPRLREFAGFVRDEVVPRLVSLGSYLAEKLGPVVKDFVETRLAALKKIFDDVKKAVQDNRPQLEQLGKTVQSVAKFIIEDLVPALEKVSGHSLPLVGTAISNQIRMLGLWVSAWNAVKTPIFNVIRYVINTFLNMVGTILNGAAKAFGWVPKIGDKLKAAAADFSKFRDSVNASLDGIDDEAIKVALKYSASGVNLSAPSHVSRTGKARGGGIFGPGTGTSDTAGLYALSNGEHVITAKEVRGAGGHGAIEAMRRMWAKGMAAGGRVFRVNTDIPSHADIGAVSSAVARQAGKDIARAAASIGPDGGPPGSVSSYRGVLLNARTIRMLNRAEAILGATFRLLQGSYSTAVAASAGTHAGGGVMDTNGPRGWSRAERALRQAGFAAWHRTPAQGPWGHHIHSVAIGDPTASPAAKRQVQSFLRGGNGLGMWRGGPVSYDRGGLLMPGLTLAYNGTGRPEPVGGGVSVSFANCTFAGTSKAQFTDLVVGAIDQAKRRGRV